MEILETERIANEICKKTDAFTTPIQIVSLVAFYGFSVYTLDYEETVLGMTLANDENIPRFNKNMIITVNKRLPYVRKRVVIAQEFSHYILNDKPSKRYAHENTEYYSHAVKEANRLALALLIPKDDVERYIPEDLKSRSYFSRNLLIKDIANRYAVPEKDASLRLYQLDIL